jgi:hypothetical protein
MPNHCEAHLKMNIQVTVCFFLVIFLKKEKIIVVFLLHVIAGSEDSNVYFYDLTRPQHTCVNKLQVCPICQLGLCNTPYFKILNKIS